MTATVEFERQVENLIVDLKRVCANYGLGNDRNEFKISTQVLFYKCMNGKFIHEMKKEDKALADKDNLEESLSKMSEND